MAKQLNLSKNYNLKIFVAMFAIVVFFASFFAVSWYQTVLAETVVSSSETVVSTSTSSSSTVSNSTSSSSSHSSSSSSVDIDISVSVSATSTSNGNDHDDDSCDRDYGHDHDDDCNDEDDDNDEDEDSHNPQKGSITLCKMIVDDKGNVLYDGFQNEDSFQIFWLNSPVVMNESKSMGIIATSTFSIPLNFNTKIFDSSVKNDAQCLTYNDLKLGDYYYGKEIVPGTNWLEPLYNDQFTGTIRSPNDFYSYSDELFTSSVNDDSLRNKNSDGNIVLSKEKPHRTLVVLNTYKKISPQPEQGKLKICKWNDMLGDGKSATSTDDTPLQNWSFDVKRVTSSGASYKLLTEKTDGCVLSELFDIGAYGIKEETKQNWNLTDIYVNGDRATNIPVSTTTDIVASILKGVTTRVDFYNHYQEPATTTPSFLISATKIICDNESDLPNWGIGGPDITDITASNWVSTHTSCKLAEGWKFQYASSTAMNPGNQAGEVSSWSTFGPTNNRGVATTTITNMNLIIEPRIWVREVMQNDYIAFAGASATTTVSAEIYCAQDVLNYDNYDFISNPQVGSTYSCVAWNVKNKEPSTVPQCSDGIDNDGDGKIDTADSACHSDGNASNSISYNPKGVSENEKPVLTLNGNATTTIFVGDIFTDSGATAYDSEDGDITSSVTASSTVVTLTAGTYSVTYDVKDSQGLSADQVTRNVVVNEKTPQPPSGGGGGGGGGSTGSSGGGGGGPPSLIGITNTTANLIISNERVIAVSPSMALVSWDTNIPATSRVAYGPSTQATSSSIGAPQYGYASSTITINNLTTKHIVAVTNVSLDATTYFRPVSTTTSATALGKELTIVPQVGECVYLIDYLRIDFQNNPSEVKKLQQFLKNVEGFSALKEDGVFNQETFDAVIAFQEKYREDVLDPWGHDAGTGFVYITTKKKVNELYCKSPFPLTVAQQAEIDVFKKLPRDGGVAPLDIGNTVGMETGVEKKDIGTVGGEQTETGTAFLPKNSGVFAGISAGGGLTALAVQAKTFLSSKASVFIILVAIFLLLMVFKGKLYKKEKIST